MGGDRAFISGETVNGVEIDADSRCRHWRSPLDIVALRFGCCGAWYSCYDCHAELADHASAVWPRDRFGEPAAMCGACGDRMTVPEYVDAGSACAACGRPFNPGCAKHYNLYFELS